MPNCPKCGESNPSGTRMCGKCGTQFPNEVAGVSEAEPRQAQAIGAAEEDVLGALRAGRKIEAIKIYRKKTGVGLAEAKEAVEAMGTEHGITPQSSGCAGVVLAALVLGGSLAACLC